MQELLDQVIGIARKAGLAVMEIYGSDNFRIEMKDDKTPLTAADRAAHEIIETGLERISEWPVVSEEGSHQAGDNDTFWLVDPIDGTKEFINRNGEFTINIALIENGLPVLGVVYAPAKKILYYGAADQAYKQPDDGQPTRIIAEHKGRVPTVVVSRSHLNDETEAFLGKLGKHEKINMGSSLKLCLVAEGRAAVYPRFAPTSLWDTAAADAVLRAAGGKMTDTNGSTLEYHPERTILNPYFIASAKDRQP